MRSSANGVRVSIDRSSFGSFNLFGIAMLQSVLFALTPMTSEWNINIAIVMIVCNILAIAIGKYTIQKPSEGPAMPSPELFGGFGLPAVIATTSFGHILGVGVILGLQSVGAL
ncbi:photosystem I reaction center subunit PsaK [Baaleninema simplex]|uniref:photosystem I reaction center subunit PsaK n=1 Tax=Baaleninema simplex TaxID=2862350 RepID=UPI00034D6F20